MTDVAAIRPYSLDARCGQQEVWWFGSETAAGRVLVKTAGHATGGRFSQIELIDPAETATPLHVHRMEDETMLVLEGHATVHVADEQFELSAGGFAFMPRDLPHAYVAGSSGLRALVTYAPAGFERFFVENGRPVDDSASPPALALLGPDLLTQRLAAYGVEIIGPPP